MSRQNFIILGSPKSTNATQLCVCVDKRRPTMEQKTASQSRSSTPDTNPDNRRAEVPSTVKKTKDGFYKGSINNLGQRHGSGIMTYNWGDIYDGEWQNDFKQGKGDFIFTDGSWYHGEWHHSAYDGKGTYRDRHGDIFEGTYHEGLREGPGIFYYTDDRVESNNFHANFPVGEGVRWSADRKTAWLLEDGHVIKEISPQKAWSIADTNSLKIPSDVVTDAKPVAGSLSKFQKSVKKILHC